MIVQRTASFTPLRKTAQTAPKSGTRRPETEKTDVYVSHQKLSVPLGEEPVSIGRHKDSAIRIDELMVSRRHAELKKVDGQLWLRDLGSTNGTYVNGESLPQGEWTPIDESSQLAFSKQPGGAVNFSGGNPQEVDSRSMVRSESGLSLPLPAEGSTLIWGRDPQLKARLPQGEETQSVSRRHVLVRQTGGSIWVNDLNSSHGTKVGGAPLTPGVWTELRPDSKLAMSNFEVGIVSKE